MRARDAERVPDRHDVGGEIVDRGGRVVGRRSAVAARVDPEQAEGGAERADLRLPHAEVGGERVQAGEPASIGAAVDRHMQAVAADLDETLFRDGAAHAASLAAVWLLIAGMTFSAINSMERRPSRLSAQSWLA